MRFLLAACLLAGGAPLAGAQSGPPPNFAAAFLGTTLGYRPPGGPLQGWQRDATLLIGYGRFLTPALAVELDAGPTLVRGRYASFALVPGVVRTLGSTVYLAGRVIVPLDPRPDLVLFPGVGLFKTFQDRLTPVVELNLSSAVGRGEPDLGVALTFGLLVSF